MKNFEEIWPLVEKITLLHRYKARLIYDLLLYAPTTGSVAECGVFRGGVVVMMALAQDRLVWAFDSFAGLPDAKSPKDTNHYQAGHMVHSETAFRNTLRKHDISEKVRVMPGWFNDTMTNLRDPLALVHVDADLYESTRTCIDRLYPLLLPGGFMIFDDYHDMGGGVAAAVDEHVRRTDERLYAGYSDQVFIVKERHRSFSTDHHQPWRPAGPRTSFTRGDNIVIDSSVPTADLAYQKDLVEKDLLPELPGGNLLTAQRITSRILAACTFHLHVLEKRQLP